MWVATRSEEHPVVGDDHGAARELEQRVLQAGQRLHVEVVGRLVEQDHVAADLQRQREVEPVALAAGQDLDRLLLVGALEPKAATYARDGISTLPTIRWSSPSETTSHTVWSPSRPERFWSTYES
jgi:hypothetical protein